jgi:hypothetical protein
MTIKQENYMKINTLKSFNAFFKLNSPELLDLRHKTALDLSFQSLARWPLSQKIAFLTSLITGMAPSKIILCRIDECMSNCIEGSDDWKYFNKWKELGYEWISIDGNNRTITINEFMNGEIPVAHGSYLLPNGKSITIDDTCDTYDTFKPEFKKYVDENVVVSLTAYVNATRADLTNLFLNINNGVSLNSQEIRNAILVPFAEWVREMSTEHYVALSKVFPTEKQRNRRDIDDYIVSMAIFATFDTQQSIQAVEKNKAYEDKSQVSMSTSRSEKLIKETLKYLKYADEGFSKTSTLFNLYMLITHIHDENIKVKDAKKFFEWFMSTENRLVGSDRQIMTTKGGESRTYASCNSTMSRDELQARQSEMMKEFRKIIGDLVVARDEERFFSDVQKYQLWKKQKGVCVATNQIIPEHEIYNIKKWHADHIVPYEMGGKTTLENGQLVSASYNMKKGNRWSDAVGVVEV